MMQQRQIDQDNEWTVILAGGDGTRLKSLTRKITGDERPKQAAPYSFVLFISRPSQPPDRTLRQERC
jgi:hypothetical protein